MDGAAAATEPSENPRHPMKMHFDPRESGMPQQSFDLIYVECPIIGGIAHRRRCAAQCSDCLGSGCPLAEEVEHTDASDDRASSAPGTEPPRGISPDEDDDREYTDTPALDGEDVADYDEDTNLVLSVGAAVDGRKGGLELPREPSERVGSEVMDDMSLWDRLVQIAQGDDAPLPIEDVSPDHLRAWHGRVDDLARAAVVHASMIGMVLLHEKKMIPHGGFQSWIAATCPFSYRSAARYMRVARWACQNCHAWHLSSLQGMSLRDVDRLLPKSGKKRSTATKNPSSSPASATGTTEEVSKLNMPGAETIHVGGVAVEDEVANTVEEPAVESLRIHAGAFDVEAALDALVGEIVASPEPQVRAVELIERLAAHAGLEVSRRGRLIAVRPTTPKKTSNPPCPPRRVLRYHDLVAEHGAASMGSAAG